MTDATLTPRQQEVARLRAHGLSAKQIARQLGISHRTVEVHEGKIRMRLRLAQAEQNQQPREFWR
jgi:RNA polymerase sigma factor (sigma-70 family)